MKEVIYYLPEMIKALKETGIMLGISVMSGLVGGLIVGILLFIKRPAGVKPNKPIMFGLNLYVNIARSFPFLLLVVAIIPLTRFVFGTAFGPVASSLPLSLVAIAIFGRLVEQVLLDLPKEVLDLANALGTTQGQLIRYFLLKEGRSGLVLSFTSMIISLMSYSTVMGVVGGGGIGDFAIRFGYQRYEYEVMYTTIIIMILIVGSIQILGTYISKKLDKKEVRKDEKLGLSVALMGLVLGFAACGNKADEKDTAKSSESKQEKVIKVASQTVPMTDVVEVAAKEAEKDGWKIELVTVNDNIQYNELLNNKEVDANFAQHEPFMMKYNSEKKGNLVAIQKIYNAKVGFYSKDYDNVADIPDGAKVAIPNDVSNEGRALAILAEEGLIKLKDGVGFEGTLKDIEENDKNLEFMSIDLLNLAEAYNEKDVALVYNYPTYIAKIGLKPADALILEKTIDERFAISLVAREDNENSEEIKALKKAMTSSAVKEFLEKDHSDTLTPAF